MDYIDFDKLLENLKESDAVLIGMGKEFWKGDSDEILAVINSLNMLLEQKNFFIVSTDQKGLIRKSEIAQERIVCPCLSEPDEYEEKQWNQYNKWLSATLAKKLLLIEMGEGFNNPNIIKWPFERITMINEKARLYRINETFYQIPPDIKEKSVTICSNSFQFLKEFLKYC